MNEIEHRGASGVIRRAPVVFAGLLGRFPTDALRQAAEFAVPLGARLDVLQLTARLGRSMPEDTELLLEEAREKTWLLYGDPDRERRPRRLGARFEFRTRIFGQALTQP